MILSYHLVAQYWVHQASSACPNIPENDMGQSNTTSNICGFRGGNGLHRQHMSRDCNVTSDDADNPNINCTRKKVKETRRFIRWVMTTSEQNGNVMPSILAHYEGKQSSKSRSKSIPAC